MSTDGGKYTFLSWLRQGLSTHINELDGTPVTGRADVTVTVGITGGTESAPIDVHIGLFGPGDVKAFDTRAIIRHWPRPDVFEVEPNYFPLLELFPADVAWRYTPAQANAQNRLRPWLGLIVLRDEEIDTIEKPTVDQPNPKLTTQPHVPLPRVDQLWAWAHVHVDGHDSIDASGLGNLLGNASHQVVARLLCSRQLDQRTAYTAFLVPTLEPARRAALGLDIDAGLDAMSPAWTNDGAAVELPVFYQWRFQTSDTGDFTSLARRIVAQPLPPTAGSRPMDVSDPGMGRTAAASVPLAVESALGPLDAQSSSWAPDERQTWTTSLAALVNLPEQRLRQPGAPRTLTPPLYGRWYAATDQLDAPGAPPWFADLNTDPRLRVAAALGWQVVQTEQQQLLAGAWAQVDAVREANTQLRHAQLAREAARRVYDRHVLVRPQPSLTLFTAPLHARVLVPTTAAPAPVTVRALVDQSPLRVGVLHPAFVRLIRPLGPLGVRQGRAFGRTPSTVIDRVNSGALPIAPPPPTPTQLVTPAGAGTEIAPPWLTPDLADWLAQISYPLWQNTDTVLDLVQETYPQFLVPDLRQQLLQFLTQIQQVVAAGGSPADEIHRRSAAQNGTLTAQQIQSAPPRPGFVAQELQSDGTISPLPPPSAPEDTRFRTAVAGAFGDINAAPGPGEVLRPVDLAATTQAASTAIDPHTTVAATFGHRIGIRPPWQFPDPLEPVMAAPSFAQPLYQPLYDISPEWLFAGFGQLSQDVAALAVPNQRFIEGFLLGANDEMGRTLLFNEYPTDQRGTYFRQFWDTRGCPNPTADITPITQWSSTAALGANAARPGSDAFLVLVVRAELLRRYPNTIVYAVQAQWKPDGSRSVPAANPVELHPEFSGSLGVGAGFWAFSLTIADARGAPSLETGPAGWYFALQEHTSEPRFGLEPAHSPFGSQPTDWQKLAWSDLSSDAASLATLGYIDLAAQLPDVTHVTDPTNARWHVADGPPGATSADLAYITYREPVRLLVHASRMIPPDA